MKTIYNAKWIKTPVSGDGISVQFTKCFDSRNVRRATLNVTAMGVYNAFVNGRRVGKYVLAPGWTDYRHRLQYQSYDITELMKNETVVVISTAPGWNALYRKDFCDDVDCEKEPAIIASIDIKYSDGSSECVLTDSSWSVYSDAVVYSHIYNGETFDETAVPEKFGNAVEFDYKKNILIPQQGEEIREIQTLDAKKLIITPSGDKVIDFGQEITGYVRFKIKGEHGDKVKILHGEMLDKNGEFYNANYRGAKAEINYTCDGKTRVYNPQHTFFGFRYIKLCDWCEEIRIENFKAVAVSSDLRRTGYFECSDAKLNKLFSNIIWSNTDNFLDIPTDCPQRDERLGWTGDAQVFCKTAALNFDTKKFFTKWLDDAITEQKEDGSFPHVIPGLNWDEKPSAAWADFAVIVPWTLYLVYGDKELLKHHYPMMKRWVDYVDSVSTNHLWLGGEHFGDWLDFSPETTECGGKTDKDLIASAFFAYSTELLINAGNAIGEDVSYYEYLIAEIKSAFIKKYIKDGRITCDTQTACILALKFGLCGLDEENIVKQLVDSIKEYGHMTTGFVGTPYILPILSRYGYSKLAYDLILRTKFPSWLYSVEKGATTTWEHWDSIKENGDMWSTDMNSFNHYAYGAVAEWMYANMAGINLSEDDPAFKKIIFSPETDERINYVKASVDSQNGVVLSEWRRGSDGRITYTFIVPENSEAYAYIGGKEIKLSAGENVIKE